MFFTGNKGVRKNYDTLGFVKTDSLFTREAKDAFFPGGARAWQIYITRKIQARLDQFTDKDYGTCLLPAAILFHR